MARALIIGDKELQATLKALGKKARGKVVRRAVTRSIKLMRKAMRDGAPRVTGTLRKRIRSEVIKTPLGFIGVVASTAPHSHLVEFGTAPHETPLEKAKVLSNINAARDATEEIFGTVAPHPGSTPNPFVRPAWDTHKRRMFDLYGRELAEAIILRTKAIVK